MLRGSGPVRRAVLSGCGSLTFLCLVASLTACGRQDDALQAAKGRIDRGAPVRTTIRVTIRAAPAVVWTTLSDISRWPSWQPDIPTTTIAAPAAAGVPFVWTTSGGTIRSRMVLYEPSHRLAWIGQMLVFRAIHVWELTSAGDGETVVTTTESLSGWPIGWLYSSHALHEADARWLAALKREAERRTDAAARVGR